MRRATSHLVQCTPIHLARHCSCHTPVLHATSTPPGQPSLLVTRPLLDTSALLLGRQCQMVPGSTHEPVMTHVAMSAVCASPLHDGGHAVCQHAGEFCQQLCTQLLNIHTPHSSKAQSLTIY